jgi:photosystem II stability/assembly factor-like uncharacterized protein
MKAIPLYLNLAALALFVAACDTFSGNDLENELTKPTKGIVDYYMLPNSVVVIDLSAYANLFKGADLKVTSPPSHGQLFPVGDGIVKYQPDWDFGGATDFFVVTARKGPDFMGTLAINLRIRRTTSTFPCEFIPFPDRAYIDGPGSVTIPVLNNDYLCGTDQGSLSLSIRSQPTQGSATVEGNLIRYTVDHRIISGDSLIYEVKTPDGKSRLGWVSLSDQTVEILRTPDDYTRGELVFIDENTGFYTGASAIYRTQDGGQTWSRVTREYEIIEFFDIQFINPKEGIALYTPCTYRLWTTEFNVWMDCGAFMLKTVDGGARWDDYIVSTPSPDPTDPHYVANVNFGSSVFFTSTTRGFVGGTHWTSEPAQFRQTIITTGDGGITWSKVFTDGAQKPGELKVRFANAQVGYAHVVGNPSQDTLLITEDGGVHWKPFISSEEIAAIAATPNGLYASLATGNIHSSPSSLVKFQDNNNSGQELMEVPYKISQIGFSPSGTLGFAGGTTAQENLGLYKSTDGGENWIHEDVGYILGGGNESERETNMRSITIPSDNVAYILFGRKIIKFTNK